MNRISLFCLIVGLHIASARRGAFQRRHLSSATTNPGHDVEAFLLHNRKDMNVATEYQGVMLKGPVLCMTTVLSHSHITIGNTLLPDETWPELVRTAHTVAECIQRGLSTSSKRVLKMRYIFSAKASPSAPSSPANNKSVLQHCNVTVP